MNLSRVTTIVLACILQHCFALVEPIRVEKDEKNEGNHNGHNTNLSPPVVNPKLRGDSERNAISNAQHGKPNRVLHEEKIDIKPGMYKIKSIYGTSISIKDDVKLVKNIDGKEVFIRSMGGKKYAIHSHEEESYMYVSGKGSNRKITRQPHAHSFEMFYIISRGENDVVSFKSAKWGNYLKAKSGDDKSVYTSTNLGGKEKFTLIFKPSDIDEHPEYTYRIMSSAYRNNLRIPKHDIYDMFGPNYVGLTKSDGSMERIVLRPLCTPDCSLYALKSAESGERYVSMRPKMGYNMKVQTRVGAYERFKILNLDTPEPGEFTYVSFKSQEFNTWIHAKKDGDLTGSNNRDYAWEKFWLYKE